MKWLIVEDALRDRKGHWLEYVSTFARELRELGDEVVVLCDRKAQGFVMEQTGARPVLPESIWHRMGDGAGALKRYLRVPGHAVATFFAMRKFFKKFNHRGYREHRDGGKREIKCENGRLDEAQCDTQEICAGAFEPDSLTSKFAESPVSESPTRSASGPTDSFPATSYPLPATSSPPDWIFVPTVLVHHLLGWWMLLKTGSVPGDSRVLLFFPNLPIRLDDEGQPYWTGGPTTKLMACFFENLRRKVESGKVVLGVETHAMRRALEGLIGMQVVYLPHPVEAQGETRVERRGSSKCEDVLTTTGKAGALEEGYPKVGPKGEGVGTSESKDTEGTEELESGLRLAAQAGASESGALAIKLVELPVSESPIRSSDTPASFLPATSHLPPITAPEALNAFLPATSYSPLSTSAKPIVFGCYGAARWEKGSDIFQEAIQLILKSEVASVVDKSNPVNPDPLPATAAGRPQRFAIQWVEDFWDREGKLVSIDLWLQGHPQVEVIGRFFEGDEYEQRLAQTDVMVLPYRSPYRLRVSRVVIEAMLNGMPVIATWGTTLFEQAEEYGAVVGCEEGNAESLADAILEVAAKFEILRARAAEKVNAAAESFSVGHFRDLLHSKMFFTSSSLS